MIDNTYPESKEESGNYLRMTLQNISKYGLSYNPISYLLWYEYATGRNDKLNEDIEIFLEQKKPLTAEIVTRLFRKHIAESQFLLVEKKALEFQKILGKISKDLNTSGAELGGQGNSLNAYMAKLNKATSVDDISGIATQIVSETSSIVNSTKVLKDQLESTVSEVNALKVELEGAKQTATTDMLTKLLNRRGFDEAMAKVLSNLKTTPEPVSIIMLDIDFFKKVNDTYGHLIGDNVLKMLGKYLVDSIKGKDIAARFGGEEFILVLPKTDLEGAYILSEQIRLGLRKMNLKTKKSGKSIGPITISLGIALLKDGESVETLIKRADDALYHAKNSGRDQTITEVDIQHITTQ